MFNDLKLTSEYLIPYGFRKIINLQVEDKIQNWGTELLQCDSLWRAEDGQKYKTSSLKDCWVSHVQFQRENTWSTQRINSNA